MMDQDHGVAREEDVLSQRDCVELCAGPVHAGEDIGLILLREPSVVTEDSDESALLEPNVIFKNIAYLFDRIPGRCEEQY